MKNKLPYFVIIASSLLLIFNLYNYVFNGDDKGFYLRIISNIVLIVAMVISIRHRNKQSQN
ncbi:hypothetical protein FLGE108171_05800 [Flavobacterium gelidilacus]|uniref:hypothetical protein n=1 Tax=Flavobacterium gelidilacus TaxID=206041 RepID=UPI00042989A0|nr:hypothetical protein [Flavobacterium gelidilacus]|tara:strand:- start:1145 stop:1327 length:183 start_codon:yes stop_codon:yes gene_type:complete